MPYLDGKEEGEDAAKERYKIILTKGDKRKLMIMSAGVLVILALVVLLLGFVHKPPLAACEGIILVQNRYSCLQNLAFSTANASVCARLPYPNNDSCITKVAEDTNSISTCAGTSGSPFYDQCVSNVSYSLQNPAYCNGISNSVSESECVYGVAKASSFSSLSYCQQIRDGYYAGLCNSMYYYGRALSLGNASYCSFLTNSVNNSILTNMSSPASVSNYTYLNFSESLYLSILNTTPRSYCYYKAALLTGNPGLCSLASGAAEELCAYSFYARANSTTNYTNLNASYLCANVPSSFKSYCIAGVGVASAVNTDNVSACLGLPTQEQFSCISTLASRYNNTSYCSYLTNSTEMSICYVAATNHTS